MGLTKSEIIHRAQLAARRVRDGNRRFMKLTPEGKRVAVARDVLNALIRGQWRAKHGIYIKGSVANVAVHSDRVVTPNMVAGKSCTVCALGAIFTATACRTALKLSSEAYLDGGRISDYTQGSYQTTLADVFSKQQLNDIERAFESEPNMWTAPWSQWGNISGANKRMKMIMKNIIRNKGTFMPGDVYG